jgi:hypothetical protein
MAGREVGERTRDTWRMANNAVLHTCFSFIHCPLVKVVAPCSMMNDGHASTMRTRASKEWSSTISLLESGGRIGQIYVLIQTIPGVNSLCNNQPPRHDRVLAPPKHLISHANETRNATCIMLWNVWYYSLVSLLHSITRILPAWYLKEDKAQNMQYI